MSKEIKKIYRNIEEIVENCKNEKIKLKIEEIKENIYFFPYEREFLRKLKNSDFFIIEINDRNIKNFYYIKKANFEDKIKIEEGYDIINNREIKNEYVSGKIYFLTEFSKIFNKKIKN